MDNAAVLNNSPADAFGNDYSEVCQFIDELASVSLDNLIQKYGENQLMEFIFNNNDALYPTVDTLTELCHSYSLKFLPPGQPASMITKEMKKELLRVIAYSPENVEAATLQALIGQVQPNLMLPQEADIADLRIQAIKLWNAYDNIEELISRVNAEDYVPDALHFYRMAPEKLAKVHQDIKSISLELTAELEKSDGITPFQPSRDFAKKLTNLFQEIGRAPLYVNSEENKEKLGELVEMMLKLDTAAQAAIKMQKNPKAADGELNLALLNIKDVIKKDVQL